MDNPEFTKELTVRKEIKISADRQTVWDALTNPEMTHQYMFGCKPITDWKVGSPLVWRGMEDGVDYVVGSVVKFDPYSVLAFTTFNPNGGYEDVKDNYLLGKYILTEEEGGTKLAIVQGNFATVPDGEERYQESQSLWDTTLNKLKQIIENK